MFSVLSDIVEMKPGFLKIFEKTTIATKTTRHIGNSIQQFLEIFIIIERAVSLIFVFLIINSNNNTIANILVRSKSKGYYR